MSNSSFRRCDLGHYYPASKQDCPHCSNPNQDINKHPEQNIKKSDMENEDKTKIISGNRNNQNQSNADKTEKVVTPQAEQDNTSNDDKTMIAEVSSTNKSKKSSTRKLIGWLVSFTLDANGVDYKLYEGRNTLGRNADNDIKIFQDNLVSSHHATILHRGNKFYVKDEMSSNPSFKNGEEIFPGNSDLLEDGDTLKFGENEFIFKKI